VDVVGELPCLPAHLGSLLFAAGKNVKQVQEWLGHADPGFTLRTYVHLLDEGLGDADFMDEAVTADPAQGNAGATRTEMTASREDKRPPNSSISTRIGERLHTSESSRADS
jgi:hypothetical protein